MEIKQDITDMNNDITITEKEVQDEINGLDISKSKRPDNINPRIIKELNDYVVKPITKISNQCLVEGVLPLDRKEACVTPIYKGIGSTNLTANYRPISLTSIIYKMLEKIRN